MRRIIYRRNGCRCSRPDAPPPPPPHVCYSCGPHELHVPPVGGERAPGGEAGLPVIPAGHGGGAVYSHGCREFPPSLLWVLPIEGYWWLVVDIDGSTLVLGRIRYNIDGKFCADSFHRKL